MELLVEVREQIIGSTEPSREHSVKRRFKSQTNVANLQLTSLQKACHVAETLRKGKCKRHKWSLFQVWRNLTLQTQLPVYPAAPAA
ncbi:hypothetical protein DPMN_120846 [Dreissena polymorpha]|uniref:Uncharacterized protein n=1 Tax=Dreissena polymorpha TaxID=45954 RepID=A0A9D4GLL6_DREPO|nr:hypothetical protein DPMN_120846 [Dreissena polymorpha]